MPCYLPTRISDQLHFYRTVQVTSPQQEHASFQRVPVLASTIPDIAYRRQQIIQSTLEDYIDALNKQGRNPLRQLSSSPIE